MPEISRFYGMVITINFNDHVPPHFHVAYGDYRAIVDIADGYMLRGNLPTHAVRLVAEWATLHRMELQKDWDLARRGMLPVAIDPLE